jgi:hypothetical protein
MPELGLEVVPGVVAWRTSTTDGGSQSVNVMNCDGLRLHEIETERRSWVGGLRKRSQNGTKPNRLSILNQ